MNRHTNNGVTGRPRNASSTVTIQITVTRQLAEALEKLAETGLYGPNRAAAAERLLSEQIRQILRDGLIAKTQKAMESR